MAQYYTVRFTTQKLIKKFGKRNELVSETKLDMPICLTALPYATAMSYSQCDNFEIEPYVMEDRRASKGSGRDPSVGNGTKKVTYERGHVTSRGSDLGAVAAKSSRSSVASAAATGNLAAAINH